MDTRRGVVYGTVLLLVALTIATGPIGLVDVPSGEGVGGHGSGSATVIADSAPEVVTIERAQHGGDVFYLRVPDATVAVTDLTGNPVLDYSISIDELGYSRGSVHFLGDRGEGSHAISLAEDTFEEDRLEADTYEAELELVLRGDEERTVLSEQVTVEVVR